MEVRGDDRRVEAESVKLPDSLVALDHSSMISMQVTCQRPRDDSILRTVSRNAYKQHPYMQEFGSSINNRLANVEAQTLPPLWLKYCDTGWEKNCLPSIGLWNMMHRKMVNGGVVKHWACINFSRCVTADIVHQCCNELTQMFRTSGMVFGMNPVPTIQGVKLEQCDNANLTDHE
jgi:eukaryotic translation initiation factor 2C